jgi:hypothetical protein
VKKKDSKKAFINIRRKKKKILRLSTQFTSKSKKKTLNFKKDFESSKFIQMQMKTFKVKNKIHSEVRYKRFNRFHVKTRGSK